jgi:hypothetical protein
MLSNICSPSLLQALALLSVKSRQNLDYSVNKMCFQCCMVHRVCPMVYFKRAWRCQRVKGIRMQGFLEITLMQPSTSVWKHGSRSISKVTLKRSCCRKPCTTSMNDNNPILSFCCDPLPTSSMPPCGCTMHPVSLPGSGDDGVVPTKRRTKVAPAAPYLQPSITLLLSNVTLC